MDRPFFAIITAVMEESFVQISKNRKYSSNKGNYFPGALSYAHSIQCKWTEMTISQSWHWASETNGISFEHILVNIMNSIVVDR